ncbi:MAG: polyprenyl synthetase family protein [Deltaproteobacteria bacterium]|nr:polyprenyl synthetase family protein [Deltaproteobacteria bacterium]
MLEKEFLERVQKTAVELLRSREVFEDITQEITGGKMIRPRTIYTLASSMKEADIKILIPLATSTELVHLASLFHDDVIDNGTIRRGRPTLNARYGNLISILAGDYFYSVASHLVLENYDTGVAKTYSDAVSHMTLMELRQASLRWNIGLGEEQYFDIIKGKTGALFSASFESIGIILKRTETEREHLKKAGMLFGEIFQLTDDLLDFIGTGTGKSRLKDLSEGDITLPSILLMKKDNRFRKLVSEYFESRGEKYLLIKEIENILDDINSPAEEINEIITKNKTAIENHLRHINNFSPETFSALIKSVSMRTR